MFAVRPFLLNTAVTCRVSGAVRAIIIKTTTIKG
jgi:hypothetical protein